MPKEEAHICSLFERRGHNDANSTTLACTIDKDIETVFNSTEKFIFELLQNADDVGLPELPVKVQFIIRGNTLIFSHNGKQFDHDDIEAICDNAQQRTLGKKLAIDKTGYKGIGFKSIFVVTDCVYILSGEYSFRFDRNFAKWQQRDTLDLEARYPWQIIPIWTPPASFPLSVAKNLDPTKVNFALLIREGVDIRAALGCILSDPKVILFLRRTQTITFDINGEIYEIRLEKPTSTESHLYFNHKLHSKWRIFQTVLDVPLEVRAQMQRLGGHECPQKLKMAAKTTVTFAGLIAEERLTKVENAVLYCYLPTKVYCGLPYLVNCDFLLSADRTFLLENIWNKFLFSHIAYLQLEWLRLLAQDISTRNQMLAIFTSQLTGNIQQSFAKQYAEGMEQAYKRIAFVPAYINPTELLYVADAVIDNTKFFKYFPELAGEFTNTLVLYELNFRNKLPCKQFDIVSLCKKLPLYARANKATAFQVKLLTFLMRHCNDYNELSRVEFVLTRDNDIVAPKVLFLPAYNTLVLPPCLKLNLINPAVFSIPDVKPWLLKLYAKETTLGQIFEQVVAISKDSASGITASDSVAIVLFLYNLYVAKFIVKSQLGQLHGLLLLTEEGKLQAAQNCYLPSAFGPKLDLQAIIQDGKLFIDAGSYLKKDITPKILGELFTAIGVQEKIDIINVTFLAREERRPEIDKYDLYCYTYQKYFFGKAVIFTNFIYVGFMNYLSVPNYAEYFWPLILQNWAMINTGKAELHINSRTRSERIAVTPYLAFYLTTFPCLLGVDGKLYTSGNLYSPVLLDKLGKRMAALLLRMKLPVRLNIEQSDFFGFKKTLSGKDCICLLDFAMSNAREYIIEDYTNLFEVMAETNFTEEELTLLRKWSGKLLAADGSLQPKDSLKFCGLNATTRTAATHTLLRILPRLNKEQMLKVCEIFAIQCLYPTELIPQYTNAKEVKEWSCYVLERLAIWAMIEAYNTGKDKYYLLKEWHTKIQNCKFYSVATLEITAKSTSEVRYPTKVYFFNNESIYFIESSRVRQDVLEIVAGYLHISPETTVKIMASLDLSLAELLECLQEDMVYDLDAIPKFDVAEQAVVTKPEIPSDGSSPSFAIAEMLSSGVLVKATTADAMAVAIVDAAKPVPVLRDPADARCEVVKFTASSGSIVKTTFSATGISLQPIMQRKPIVKSAAEVEQSRTTVDPDMVGRWGEELVFLQLQKHYKEKYPDSIWREVENGFILEGVDSSGHKLLVEVVWLNKNIESGAPVDLTINKNGKLRYIEVKASNSDTLIARVTKSEWALMQEKGATSNLFFVYNAGSQGTKIVKIKNPVSKVLSGELKPYEVQFKI